METWAELLFTKYLFAFELTSALLRLLIPVNYTKTGPFQHDLALRCYQEQLVPELAARDVQLMAISPQLPDGSLSMREKQQLTFTVLPDPGNEIATTLGVLTRPWPEPGRQRYRDSIRPDSDNRGR